MTGPAWISVGLAMLMLLISAGSAARLLLTRRRARHTERDVDALHVLMGLAMAGMFEPRISPAPNMAWIAVFAAGGAWFTWQVIRARVRRRASRWNCANPAPHVVECAAMMYMLVPGGSAGHRSVVAMPGMGGAATANPAIALLLALFMLGYIVWTADQVTAQSRAKAPTASERHTVTRSEWPSPGGARTPSHRDGPTNLSAVVLAPRLAASYKIVMSIAMGYMLVGMV